MIRFIVILLSMVVMIFSPQVELQAKSKSRSETFVDANGVRCYLHMVERGDTLYSLSKLYDVTVDDILNSNDMQGNDLSVAMRIRVPLKVNGVVVRVEDDSEVEAEEDESDLHGDEAEDGEDSLSGDGLGYDEENPNLRGYRVRLDGVAPSGLKFYTAVYGDSYDSIAEEFEMSVEQLRRENGVKSGDDSLRMGRIMLVRDGSNRDAAAPFTQERSEEIEQAISEVEFRTLEDQESLRVALLLPLSVSGRTMKPIVEFYQGVLLGVESLTHNGRSVELNLYNTERSAARISEIISDPNYRECDLIIGPVYEELLGDVLQDAEARSVPVVSPLATLTKSDSPVLFQMAPDPKYRYDKMDDLLGDDRCVTLIEGESNDESFRGDVLKVLASRDVEYWVYDYEYEHPSLIEERAKEAEKSIKMAKEIAVKLMREHAMNLGDEVVAEEIEDEIDLDAVDIPFEQAIIDSLGARVSRSDLTPLLLGEDMLERKLLREGVLRGDVKYDTLSIAKMVVGMIMEKELDEEAVEWIEEDVMGEGFYGVGNVVEDILSRASEPTLAKRDLNEPIRHTIFVLSDSEVEVDRVLSALSSAYAAQIAESRGSGRDIRSLIKYDVVANPEWRRYKNIDRAVYFRNQVVLFSSYAAGRDSQNIRHFDSRYGSAFGELPSLYSYRGFDAMMIFGEGLFSNSFGDVSDSYVTQPLQSEYRFERGENGTLMVNTNWVREEYRSNFTKEIK